MKPIRFILCIIISSFGFIGVYGMLSYCGMNHLNEDNAYLCNYIEKKVRQANTVGSPKLIIIGGSSAYVGISAKTLEASLGIPTYNFGLHAALSTDFIFYQAKRILRKNDIVLLSLEYSYYSYDEPTSMMLNIVYGIGKSYIQTLSIKEKIHILLSQPILRIIKSNIPGFDKEFRNSVPEFGSHGDATYNLDENVTQAMRDRVHDEKGGFLFKENSNGVQAIRQFIQWAKENNIYVIATWPNLAYKDLYQQQDVKDNLHKVNLFYQQFNVPIVFTPYEAMFSEELFYDTSYHLTQKGVNIRTQLLIEPLRNVIHHNRKKNW
ncbi:MAG: hypothetical protein HQK77_17265 [Desulfobacterales bacterium]|nr:hypothetical protein [Desulfobacterales bacterium]